MPKLKPSTELIRQDQAIAVFLLRRRDPKLSKKEACEKVGITTDVYDAWIETDPESMQAIREYIGATQRHMLFQISEAWPIFIGELIVDVTDPHTKTKDRIQAGNFLKREKGELERNLHATPGAEEEAQKFLKEGPRLHSVSSRMASVEVKPNSTGDGVNIEINRYSDIIDGKLSDPDS